MSNTVEKNQAKNRISTQMILFILAIISSPLLCCSISYTLSALPGGDIGLFKVNVTIKNTSGETLYLTPITTSYGKPEVIQQPASIRQINIPLQPNNSVLLTYDAADFPLDGIAVCRINNKCRLLTNDGGDIMYVDSFENLPVLDSSWLQVIQSTSPNNFAIVVYPLLGLIPIAFFLSWLYLLIKSRFSRADERANK